MQRRLAVLNTRTTSKYSRKRAPNAVHPGPLTAAVICSRLGDLAKTSRICSLSPWPIASASAWNSCSSASLSLLAASVSTSWFLIRLELIMLFIDLVNELEYPRGHARELRAVDAEDDKSELAPTLRPGSSLWSASGTAILGSFASTSMTTKRMMIWKATFEDRCDAIIANGVERIINFDLFDLSTFKLEQSLQI